MKSFRCACNLAKPCCTQSNGGVDENLKMVVGPKSEPIKGDVLNYDEVMERMITSWTGWLNSTSPLNIIHYMYDKYSYEASLLMALHDRDVIRTMACGIAGLSVAADSCLQSNMRKLNRFVTKTVWLSSTSKSKCEYPQLGNK
ncbi:hypothetical protein MJ585_10130 [Klebsiella pneumoniae]|nr:hypothetical protein MJ585_10130 [Klebsiella pneumoniae]